ncbi:MAG: L-lactate dehydrogenase [Endomicrobium sp.]|jgi:L-lactate dehydrogenase|uniref:L-lactate dehydrogenase n=1 Tax=Candidatus Endomicrobiellum cubanum TaxID=3242325 RepID=UPI002839A19A|nr:L-lactate dehydrogenase [Endomicrobium sp.]
MINLTPKVCIVGCGNVGMRYAYSMIISGVTREMVLVDYNREKAEGEAMDLSHGAPFVSPIKIYAGDYPDTANSDLVVISAGRGQKPGETRIDLIKANAEIFKTIIPEIVEYSPNAIILVATNPVDILSYITYKISGKPAKEVIGSGTVLDTARLRYLIGKELNVDSRNIHASIFGEHGDSEFPVWSKAVVGDVFFKEYFKYCNKDNNETKLKKIFEDVRDSAYKIIEKKGETSYGIGLSLTKISKAILKNQNSVLPVSSLLENYYGISDLYLSVPAIVSRQGIRQVMKVEFDKLELEALKNSALKIKEVIKASGF